MGLEVIAYKVQRQAPPPQGLFEHGREHRVRIVGVRGVGHGVFQRAGTADGADGRAGRTAPSESGRGPLALSREPPPAGPAVDVLSWC
ncbi:hypothetical protein GCM10010272_71260 [Streptomyces lateritius]|nr:hypothetical protein GCM10010272_71260 [Streptomyces lateritius]